MKSKTVANQGHQNGRMVDHLRGKSRKLACRGDESS